MHLGFKPCPTQSCTYKVKLFLDCFKSSFVYDSFVIILKTFYSVHDFLGGFLKLLHKWWQVIPLSNGHTRSLFCLRDKPLRRCLGIWILLREAEEVNLWDLSVRVALSIWVVSNPAFSSIQKKGVLQLSDYVKRSRSCAQPCESCFSNVVLFFAFFELPSSKGWEVQRVSWNLLLNFLLWWEGRGQKKPGPLYFTK